VENVEDEGLELLFLSTRGGEPICYHGPQITFDFILKFYLYLTMKNRGFL